MATSPELFDTLTQKLQPLPASSAKNPLRLFVCGPTVYNYLHIGNGRTYLVFDSFVKYLRASGIDVFYLQNITNVDDKIIIQAERSKETPEAIAKKYEEAYLKNMKELGVTAVTKYAPATEFIPQIVDQVERLLEKGHVYKTDDGYYFDLATFPDYGKLAHRTISQAEDGVTRIDESVKKKNRGDFCVWKFSKPGEPIWKTRLGDGRPGWHIEDTAISEHFFGPQYDIHGAGVDLKFPHHEAEIAQEESVSGKKPFVTIWMHVGSLTVSGKKMSKSLGNFITINDFLAKHSAEVLRLMSLSNHYRSPLDYTEEAVQAYEQSWKNIIEFVEKLQFAEKHSKLVSEKDISESEKEMADLKERFFGHLHRDFGTPQALAEIFSCMSSVQPNTWKLSKGEAKTYRQGIGELYGTLGFTLPKQTIPAKVTALVKDREAARKHQQFVQSDELRKQINGLGYNLDDTPFGPFVRPR